MIGGDPYDSGNHLKWPKTMLNDSIEKMIAITHLDLGESMNITSIEVT